MRATTVAGLGVAALLASACGSDDASALADCGPAPAVAPVDISSLPPLTALPDAEPLPDAALPVLGGDGCLHTTELLGQPSVINFWATWCAFCVDEMPDLEAVHREVAGEVRFIGVDREDVADKALDLAEGTGVTYELVEDRDGSFFRAVLGRGMPTTLLVDAEGVIRYQHAGPLEADQLRDLILEHLGI